MTKLSGPMLPPASGNAPKQAVIMLHGYGSDGNDMIGLAPYWRNIVPDAIFLSPDAPNAATAAGFGYQWFAIDWAGDRLASRQTGVVGARPVIVEFLTDLWMQTGIAPEQTILGGFSQGAMMALHVGLSLPVSQRLMGVIGVAGALLPPDGFGGAAYARPPVCLVHGDLDEVVAPGHSAEADALLRGAGYDVSYHVSTGVGHGIAPDGIDFIARFIGRVAQS